MREAQQPDVGIADLDVALAQQPVKGVLWIMIEGSLEAKHGRRLEFGQVGRDLDRQCWHMLDRVGREHNAAGGDVRSEPLFKALKQNLKIKTFVGTWPNAVKIQVWSALIAILLLL